MLSSLGLEYSFRKGLKPDSVSDIQILLEEEHGNTEKTWSRARDICKTEAQNRGNFLKVKFTL